MTDLKKDEQRALAAMAQLEPEPNNSTRAVMLRNMPEIAAQLAKGITHDQIAEAWTQAGFRISGRVLASYFYGWPGRPKTSRVRRRRETKNVQDREGDNASAAVSAAEADPPSPSSNTSSPSIGADGGRHGLTPFRQSRAGRFNWQTPKENHCEGHTVEVAGKARRLEAPRYWQGRHWSVADLSVSGSSRPQWAGHRIVLCRSRAP